MLWVMMPIVVFKVNDMMFKPDDQDEDGQLIYGSWTHKQYAEPEEEDDDWTYLSSWLKYNRSNEDVKTDR